MRDVDPSANPRARGAFSYSRTCGWNGGRGPDSGPESAKDETSSYDSPTEPFASACTFTLRSWRLWPRRSGTARTTSVCRRTGFASFRRHVTPAGSRQARREQRYAGYRSPRTGSIPPGWRRCRRSNACRPSKSFYSASAVATPLSMRARGSVTETARSQLLYSCLESATSRIPFIPDGTGTI